MKYLLVLGLLALAGCVGAAIPVEEQIERGSTILGQLFTGNYGGAVGGTVDLALILLGLKGAQVGARKAKQVVQDRVMNPKAAEKPS